MRETLSLKYTGKRLKAGMDAEDVATAIQGFAAVVRAAGAVVYGSEARIEFKIRSARNGSLSIGFVMEVFGATQALIAVLPQGPSSISDTVSLLKSWFALMKHLGGKPAAKTQRMKKSSGIQIQNTSGDIKIFNIETYNAFNSYDVGGKASDLAQPLKNDAENLEIRVQRRIAAKVNEKEASSLRSSQAEEKTLLQTSKVFLKVVAPVLEGEGKWRFKSGKNTITATVADLKFLADVQTGRESFSAGDILTVRLQSSQTRVGDLIRDRHIIEEVLFHEKPVGKVQPKLL